MRLCHFGSNTWLRHESQLRNQTLVFEQNVARARLRVSCANQQGVQMIFTLCTVLNLLRN